MANNHNKVIGLMSIIAGTVIIALALGDLLVRVLISLTALSLINYGLRLRGLPPMQVLIPMIISRHRFFR